VEGNTLHVTDWKTTSIKAQKDAPKARWWNQILWYTYLILTNNLTLEIKKVVLTLEVYARQATLEDTIASFIPHTITMTAAALKRKMKSWVTASHRL